MSIPTPEAYFQSLELELPAAGELTADEARFLRQYAGLLLEPAPARQPAPAAKAVPARPPAQSSAPQPPAAPAAAITEPTPAQSAEATPLSPQPAPLPATPRTEAPPAAPSPAPAAASLRLVGFLVAGEVYFLPVAEVQEVLPYAPPTRLPAAPRAVAGILQLRGRVTPIIRLDELLGTPARPEDRERFIVLARAEGLQLGLAVHGLAPMRQVEAGDIEWNVEARLGETSPLVAGIVPHQGRLSSILSAAAIRRAILQT